VKQREQRLLPLHQAARFLLLLMGPPPLLLRVG